MSSKKKYKLIAIASSGAVVATGLAAAVPAVVINAQKHNQDSEKEPTKPISKKVTPVGKEYFNWDSTGKIIQGFKSGVDVESLIDENGKLGLPACDQIADHAFAFAFEDISKNVEICFESSIKAIGESSFFGNKKMNAFSFVTKAGTETKTPSLNKIGKCAFEKTGITKAIIPATCNEIGERAFYKCSNLSTIDLAARTNLLKNVGSHAFQDLANTTDCKLVVSGNMRNEAANAIAANMSTHEWGGVNFSNWKIYKDSNPITKTKTIPTLYLNIDDDKVLKSGVKCGSISDYEAIFVPQEVKEIDSYAFANNEKINVLAFENNSQCSKIGVRAFYNCKKLCANNQNKDLVMPSALAEIGWQAFLNCESVRKLDFSNVVYDNRSRTLAIGIEAFLGWWMDPYKSETKYVGPSVEKGSQSKEDIQNMFKHALSETGQLNETWIVLDTNPMSDKEFEERSTRVEIPVVGDEKYEYHLTSFNWKGVEEEGFNTIRISPDIAVIETTAFWDEETQTTKIPDTIKTIDMSKSKVREIGENAFRSSNIQTVIFPDSTETIGASSFQDCKKLNGVTLPPSLQSIGANAFKGCDNAYYLDLSKLTNDQLKEIIAKQNAGEKVIGDNAFEDFGILQQAGGTIIWADGVEDEVKTGIINILVGTGLPETWVKENPGESGYTGGIPEKYNGNSILVINHDELSNKFTLQSINWSVLEDYIRDIEERTGVEVDSLPLIIPSHVTDIADDFWGNPSSSKLSVINKLSFANNSKCKTIGANAFAGASNFTGDLIIPNGVTEIKDSAFANCTNFDGTLSLPNTLEITTAGVASTAFENITTFKTLNISSWDDSYIHNWDATGGKCPLSNATFEDFSKETFVQTNDSLSATSLSQIKTALFDVADLPSETLGTEISKYTSQIPTIDITSELTEELKAVDSEDKKKIVAERYVDLINEGAEIEGTYYSGIDILTNDLLLTFKNAAVNSPALASSSPSINVRLTNVDVSGQSISFDIVANINVYSNTYKYGYVSQFATKVKDLLIVSADQYPTPDITQTAKQVGIMFTTDESTVFETSYDKQYIYGTSKDGSSFKKTAFDLTNKKYEFKNLDGKFQPNVEIDGDTTAASALYDQSRQAFLSAPSLFGVMFGAYDYGSIYSLINGCDKNGYLYSPFLKTSIDNANKLKMTYTPLSGKLASSAFANYNIYGQSKDAYNNDVWTINTSAFNSTQVEHEAEELTRSQALSAYKDFITDENDGYTKELGQKFREEILYGFIEPLKQYIASIAENYKFIENNTVEFTKLENTPIIEVDGNDVIANFGLNIKIFLHDDEFVTANDQSGTEVSAYKHSYELYIPMEFKNVKLNFVYTSDEIKGVNWSIFDNNGGRDTCMTLGSTDGLLGPYYQEFTYNESTKKFDRKLLYEIAGDYNYSDIYNELIDPEQAIKTTSDLDKYMAKKWPLLTSLNILHSDNDQSTLHICIGYSSKYLNKVTIVEE